MATKARQGDRIGVGVAIQMDVVGGAKAANDMKRASDSIDRSLNKVRNAVTDHESKLAELNRRYKAGAVSKKEYEAIFNRLKSQESKRIERLEKERRAVQGLDQQESLLQRKRMQRERMAGMAASGVSGLGMGGQAAGAARFLGGTAGLGGGAAAIGFGFGGLALVKASVAAYADLEEKVASLRVLFGQELGTRLTEQFRALAASTALTNNQLIENAKTWASYGLTTEGLTDRLRRLGTVAGGNSEKFRALTIAFAQVNAQGKLMGQEKNQLINAGMSLQSVAAAAGISMDEFADAMKNGEIRAEHLNQALIDITSEGGLFAGYLEAQADTLKGKMTILTSAWEEFLQALGEAEEGPAGKFLDKLIQATKSAKDIVPLAEEIDFSAGLKGDLVDALGNLPARAYAMFAEKIGREAVEDADLSAAYKAMGSGLSFLFGQAPSAGGIGMGESFDKTFGRIANLLPGREASDIDEEIKARKDAQKRVDAALEQEAKERLRRRREIEQTILDDLSSNWDLTQQQFANALSNITKDSPVFEKAMELFVSRIFTEGGEGFVGPMPATRAIEEGAARNKQQLLDAAQFEIDVAEQEIKNANQRHKLEMELLDIKEKEVAQALAMDKKIAAGPQQKDAMFTGGSVEEFMFLRRQTQINETAKAVKEAENSAAEQRRQIEADRKAADAIRDGKIDALTTAIDQLYQEISNLND